MGHTVIKVVPHRRAWRVVSDGSERLEDVFSTKERAVEHALELARRLESIGDVSVSVDSIDRTSVETYAP